MVLSLDSTVRVTAGQPFALSRRARKALAIPFGRFVCSNSVLCSDFLWFIELLFLLSLVAAIVLVVVPRHGSSGDSTFLAFVFEFVRTQPVSLE